MVAPGLSEPFSSASSIIATATRSFTLPVGLNDSIFTSTSASKPSVKLFNLTIGVFPIASVMLSNTPLFNSGIFAIIFILLLY